MSPTNTVNLIAADDVAACNRLLAQAFAGGADAVVLAPPQVSVPPQAMAALERAHGDHPYTVAGCRVVDARHPARIQFPGWRWDPSQLQWSPLWLYELKPANDAPAVQGVAWLNPEGVLIPKVAWSVVGPFEERLCCPLAVMDWCLRANGRGISCLEVKDAVVEAGPGKRAHSIFEAMLLASRHGLPHGKSRLAVALLGQALGAAFRPVRFWADYGQPVSLPKRMYWHLRNLLAVFGHGSLRETLRHVLSGLGARAWK